MSIQNCSLRLDIGGENKFSRTSEYMPAGKIVHAFAGRTESQNWRDRLDVSRDLVLALAAPGGEFTRACLSELLPEGSFLNEILQWGELGAGMMPHGMRLSLMPEQILWAVEPFMRISRNCLKLHTLKKHWTCS